MESSCPLAQAIDDSDDFMARGHARTVRQQVTFGQMEIGAADATRPTLHTNLANPRQRNRSLHESERALVHGRRPVDDPRMHPGGP